MPNDETDFTDSENMTTQTIQVKDIFDVNERVAVFIDGQHLYQASRNLGFDVDYKALRSFFQKHTTLYRVNYYVALPDKDDYSPLRPLVDWLQYNGYHLTIKPSREFTDASGRRHFRNNVNTEIVVESLRLANLKSDRIDHVVLFSGDGDLSYLVKELQNLGLVVSVISTLKNKTVMIADELRRQVDNFIDLGDIYQNFRRQHDARDARETDNAKSD